MTIVPLELAGKRRANYAVLAHAIEGSTVFGGSRCYAGLGEEALCGAKPKGAAGWNPKVQPEVTCPKCLRKMERAK